MPEIKIQGSDAEGTDVTFGPSFWCIEDFNGNGLCWGLGFHVGRWMIYLGSQNQ